MVRKIMAVACMLVLIMAFAMPAQAATHQVYDGTPSNTYITYFRDVISGIGFHDNYVAFRSGQYEYVLVVGKLELNGNTISLVEPGTIYKIYNENTYNSRYQYAVSSISDFSVDVNDNLLYSDLGQFPQLVSRGEKYEMLNTLLICIMLLGFVLRVFFRSR